MSTSTTSTTTPIITPTATPIITPTTNNNNSPKNTSGIPPVDQSGRPLPQIEDAAKLMAEEVEPPPVLIEGLLHVGSKLVIGGSSKACKTWTLLGGAMCVATGVPWWGKPTYPGRVLYINFEIQPPFFTKRLKDVGRAGKFELVPGQLDIWNLRGHAADLTMLKPKILSQVKDRGYALIVLDPIYKCLGNRDENKAGEIAGLMNEIEALAVRTGAAVAFGAHYSKGNQAAKESIDRIGGSGVFARDPDSILTLTKHREDDAFTVEATLRNFAPIEPFCVRWEYPLMILATDLDPADLKQAERSAREPTDEQFIALFDPDLPDDNPRAFLRSNAELAADFKVHGYDKNALVATRDRLEGQGKIGVVRNLPRNQVLTGRPDAVAAFNRLSPAKKAKCTK